MKKTVGILAYGSLIWEPGDLDIDLDSDPRQVWTPFNVEFARESGRKRNDGSFGPRGGAPTLVPVPIDHGKQVKAQILLHNSSKEQAVKELFIREGGDWELRKSLNPKSPYGIDCKYDCTRNVSQEIKIHEGKKILINCLLNFDEPKYILFAQLSTNIKKIGSKIQKLTPEHLACLAIISVKNACANKDGISYLHEARRVGIETCLSRDYAKKILEITDTESGCLVEARDRVKDKHKYYAKAKEKLKLIRDNL